METSRLPCVEIEPPRSATHAVIWLHGLGADGHDFEPIVPYLGLPDDHAVRFVFPTAPARPVTVNAGMVMPAWYDIRALTLSRDVDTAGVEESAAHVRSLIAHEVARGVATERIVLAGFSQGGAVAIYQGVRYPERLAGIVALSTYLVHDEAIDEERSEANRATPFFQGHGERDPMVQIEAGRIAHRRLTELGYEVDFRTYPMGHEVHPREIRDIGEFLNRVLGLSD